VIGPEEAHAVRAQGQLLTSQIDALLPRRGEYWRPGIGYRLAAPGLTLGHPASRISIGCGGERLTGWHEPERVEPRHTLAELGLRGRVAGDREADLANVAGVAVVQVSLCGEIVYVSVRCRTSVADAPEMRMEPKSLTPTSIARARRRIGPPDKGEL
jgi:hypothetical protein